LPTKQNKTKQPPHPKPTLLWNPVRIPVALSIHVSKIANEYFKKLIHNEIIYVVKCVC
jgi:hypothetical protein